MTLRIELSPATGMTQIVRPSGWDPGTWRELTRAARGLDPNAGITADRIELNWPLFLSYGRTLALLQRRFGFDISYDDEVRSRLERYRKETAVVAASFRSTKAEPISTEDLYSRLAERGWDPQKRLLTEPQVRDLMHLVELPHGANFSIPGAGKTTVALALNLLTQAPETDLLVVAPKNAFPAWDEVIDECLTDGSPRFERLIGGRRAIRQALRRRPARAIVGYGQFIRILDLLAEYMQQRPVHLILDESHRIKAGADSQTGQAALSLGPYANRRDILSGTPMPNNLTDLVPQFEFLWPAQDFGRRIMAAAQPSSVIRPLYARTVERELGIPEAVVDYQAIAMSDAQRVLYGLLRDDFLRRMQSSRSGLVPGMRTAVMRLLQAAIDPQAAVAAMLQGGLASASEGDIFRLACRQIMEEDVSPRFEAAERRARDLVGEGRKVVIWVPFRYTLDRLLQRLSDLGALPLHGGIEAGDESEEDTREWVVKQFHDDDARRVLVANPAAGGEGISLHRVCQDAIYMGRTYNAAHYLQSRKRIHRLGLPAGATARMTIFESTAPLRFGSIDRSVRRRLDSKIAAMAAVFDDPELRAISLESLTADPTLDDGLSFEDVLDLIRELDGSKQDDPS